VDGAADSQHCYGKAADITAEGFTSEELAAIAKTIPALQKGGIGTYRGGRIHVDVRGYKARW
jgi:uncharacterized protein YcbK (DUF882 family)